MRKKTITAAGSIAFFLVFAMLLAAAPMVLAKQEPKEVVTSRGSFPLDERGMPEKETMTALFDEMDYQGAVQAYLWALPQMDSEGQRKMAQFYGAKGNLDFLTLYKDPGMYGMLTPNTIVEYVINFYDFTEMGPMVLEMPGGKLVGIMMDYQMRWVADLGLVSTKGASPEKVVFIGPNQSPPDEALANGWRIERVKTNVGFTAIRVLDPEKDKGLDKKIRLYPWSKRANPSANKIFKPKPNDKVYYIATPKGIDYWERLNDIVQQEVVFETDRYMMSNLKALGIEKGKPFKPTKRQKDIMERAAFTGEKMAIAASFEPRSEYAKYSDDSNWFLPLTVQPEHMTEYTQQLEERVAWFYSAYGLAPAMKASIPGKGSTYFASYRDAKGDWLDGGANYQFTVSPNPPAAQFWALTVYNVSKRGVIQNGEDHNVEISSLLKGLKKNKDGSVDVYFGPKAPAGKESNWIKTNKGKNWFAYFRLYGPTEKYFDKSWPINDIKKVK